MNAQLYREPPVSGIDPRPTAVASHLPAAPWPLAPVGTNAVALDFDGGRFSSEAGRVRRQDIDAPRGLTRALAAVLSDPRDGPRIPFPPEDLLQQRGFHMAAGYEDANDSHRRRDDPLFTLRRDRRPATGAPWASPPTLSRCANRIARTQLYRMALVLRKPWIASYVRPPSVIVRDVDDPEAPGHGAQEQARDEGYEGGDCGRPLHLEAGLSGRLITTMLQSETLHGYAEARGVEAAGPPPAARLARPPGALSR